MKLVGPQSQCGSSGKVVNRSSLPEIKLLFLGSLSRNLDTIPSSLFHLLHGI
jgi:hypothetical protein